MFLFILFLIVLGAAAYFILSYSRKIDEQKRQIMVLSRQNKKLKSEMKNKSQNYLEEHKLIVKYIYSSASSGIVNCNVELYAAPTEEIFGLGKVMSGLGVEILDSCIVNNEKWYEVRFRSNQNINNKGWMKAEHITLENN